MPLIVITADRPPELRGRGAGQTIDQLKLYGVGGALVLRARRRTRPTTTGLLHFRSAAARAVAEARGRPPGPGASERPAAGAARAGPGATATSRPASELARSRAGRTARR